MIADDLKLFLYGLPPDCQENALKDFLEGTGTYCKICLFISKDTFCILIENVGDKVTVLNVSPKYSTDSRFLTVEANQMLIKKGKSVSIKIMCFKHVYPFYTGPSVQFN